MLTKPERLEYNFFKKVHKIIRKDNITKEDLIKIYKYFKKFCDKLHLDEIDLLRKGEVFLGRYCDSIDYKDLDKVYDVLDKCFYNSIELTSPVTLVMIATITKLALAEFEGKEIINKETDNNENDDL